MFRHALIDVSPWYWSRTVAFHSTQSQQVCFFGDIVSTYVDQYVGYPVPGETVVYDRSQEIDPEKVELHGGFLLKTLVLSIDPYLRGQMRDSDIPSYMVSSVILRCSNFQAETSYFSRHLLWANRTSIIWTLMDVLDFDDQYLRLRSRSCPTFRGSQCEGR